MSVTATKTVRAAAAGSAQLTRLGFRMPNLVPQELLPRSCGLFYAAQTEHLATVAATAAALRPPPPCLTCQGTGYIPTEQVNELVALIPHSDQRLRPQRTKQYVLLSVLLCLLASGLVVFFLFPHSVLVDDDGIKVVKVTFNKQDSLVILAITATLKIRNSNFYPVAVTSLSSQVQYMNTVVGSYLTSNVSLIPPRSEHLVNFTAKAEMGGPFSYVYFFCTLPDILVHNIVVFMRTSVKISYIGHMTQSSLETHHYVDCGANSTAV